MQPSCLSAPLRLLLCLSLAGCAVLPTPPGESVREGWGTLVVAPARYPPQSNIRAFAVGKGAGTAKGAVTGSAAGLVGSGAFAAAGALNAVIAPYLAVIMLPVMGVAGAYAGGQAAISAQEAAALESHLQHSLSDLRVPATLARAIVDTAQQDAGLQLPLLADAGPAAPETTADYLALAQQGVDSVLEVAVTEVGFSGDKQLRFYLVANIRVVRSSDGVRLYERELVYQSDAYRGQRWGEDQAALFAAELQRACASLAGSAVEQVFLLTALPLESRAQARPGGGLQDLLGGRDACGLAWVSPEHDSHWGTGARQHSEFNRFPGVTSRQPTLSWEAFPRDRDRAAARLPGVSNVRYDLRVWQALTDAPPRLLYERRDLAAPTHTLELPLSPTTRYFWSARARFDLGGRRHGTKWGYFRTPYYASYASAKVKPEPSPAVVLQAGLAGVVMRDPCTLDFIPTSNYYRFQTP